MKTIESVLLVDDSEADLFLAEHFIKETGRYGKVIKARDGVEALEVLGKMAEPPSLILLDINMPRMDGWRFVENLKGVVNATHMVVVVMLTSSFHDSDRARAESSDLIKDYLVKPPNMENLIEIAERFGSATT